MFFLVFLLYNIGIALIGQFLLDKSCVPTITCINSIDYWSYEYNNTQYRIESDGSKSKIHFNSYFPSISFSTQRLLFANGFIIICLFMGSIWGFLTCILFYQHKVIKFRPWIARILHGAGGKGENRDEYHAKLAKIGLYPDGYYREVEEEKEE